MEVKVLSEDDGGLVEEVCKKYKLVIFKCMCEQEIENPNFEGYPHDGGIADKNGKKWWMYATCQNCDYAWAIDKIENRAKLFSKHQEESTYELLFKEVTMMHHEKLFAGIPNMTTCLVYSVGKGSKQVTITPIMSNKGESPISHVAALVEKLKPDCYIVVSEAFLQGPPDVPEQEMLAITGRSKDGKFDVTKMWRIVRAESDEKTVTEIIPFKIDLAVAEKLP